MVKILISGDYCPVNRADRLIKGERYSEIFNESIQIFQDSDYSITNLECPITTCGNKIQKAGAPHFRTSVNALDALEYAGFNLVTLSNNHIMDYGVKGLESTLEHLNTSPLDYIGVGNSLLEARRIFYKTINDEKFAIINISENEWATTNDDYPGANPLNIIANYYDITEARVNARYVIVIVHGGHEYYPLPSPRMQETYKYFIDAGATAVIGHHTHCYSGYEIYKGSPIIYSLGNFVFDWNGKRRSAWNIGTLAELELSNGQISFTLTPFYQFDDKPGLRRLTSDEEKEYNRNVTSLNSIITDEVMLKKKYDEYIKDQSRLYESYLEPYSGRILSSLYFRKILPPILSIERRKLILNIIRCESHRDIMINVLNKS
jgi:poly-gamma-glutamate capsule biosynthesis protein CapA/YwtB (metallophosphatase superfamily)